MGQHSVQISLGVSTEITLWSQLVAATVVDTEMGGVFEKRVGGVDSLVLILGGNSGVFAGGCSRG
jgi:hypothetical protein